MRDERQPGATFAPGDLGFIDFESKSTVPISRGTDVYSRSATAIMLAFALGDGDIAVVETAADLSRPLDWRQMPKEFQRFHNRVVDGDAWYVAHNAAFDRAIWNRATRRFPKLEPWHIIDTRVQATASGLPASLDMAAKYAGCGVLKDKRGKALIKLFCEPESTATALTNPLEWAEFRAYAGLDIGAMRDLFRHTRQLPFAEWREYWAAEAVNDEGVGIDMELAKAAAVMAEIDKDLSARELTQITARAVTTVNQVQKITGWVMPILPAEGREILVKRQEERDEETGDIVKPQKNALTRDRILRLLAYLEAAKPLSPQLAAAERVLQIRLYGGSKTPAKFKKMLDQQVDGVIRNQYVFGGASQTGRFSSKGVQIHNLMRDAFDWEIDAIDALTGGISAQDFAELGDPTPISRKLSLLIRPTLVAPPGRAFVWGDLANVEARLTPWLADDREADERLEIFSAVDRGEEKYDVYTRSTAELSGIELSEVTKELRQRGKVVELACTFGGGVGALLAMAASYHMHLTEGEAKAAVERWRAANPWAPRFWGKHNMGVSYGLWGAINKALENPGQEFSAGRITYVFLRNYLGGSLLCRLPSGRFLTYRRIRWEDVPILDEDTDEVIDIRRELLFSRDMGRVKLWPGLACENVTQAAAADLLRGTLVRLADQGVRLHTHDEILMETGEDRADTVAAYLVETMSAGFDWTDGLPIAADATIGRWYSKSKASWGL